MPGAVSECLERCLIVVQACWSLTCQLVRVAHLGKRKTENSALVPVATDRGGDGLSCHHRKESKKRKMRTFPWS